MVRNAHPDDLDDARTPPGLITHNSHHNSKVYVNFKTLEIFIFQNNNFYVKSDIITQYFFQSEIQFADIFQVMPTFVHFKQLFFVRIFGYIFQPFFEAF